MNDISPGINQFLGILFWDKPVDISVSVYRSRDLNLHALGQHFLFSPVSYMAFILYISPRSKAAAGISVVNLVPVVIISLLFPIQALLLLPITTVMHTRNNRFLCLLSHWSVIFNCLIVCYYTCKIFDSSQQFSWAVTIAFKLVALILKCTFLVFP